MKRLHVLTILALVAILPLSAQRAKKKNAGKKKPAPVEVKQEDPRIAQMLEATQRVVFIDSIVVDKADLLSEYWLSTESGQLMTYADFFHQDTQPYSIVHKNELGNKAWLAKSGVLYTTDLLGGKEWNAPVPLAGLDNGIFSPANYPFMMADGTTFYFAAQGQESIGGLDIFITRYDSGSGRFLQPENIGMPFNSEANDYMMAIDEMNNLGYFATDRRQPEGKVCIYMFIPNQTRQTYEEDELDEKTLRSLADIECIANTWGNGAAREQALARLKALKEQALSKSKNVSDEKAFTFYVDDQKIYHSLADFVVLDNRTRYMELQKDYEREKRLEQDLEQLRSHFSAAKDAEREYLKNEILQNEQNFYNLQRQIKLQEKNIRNSEIKARY